MSEPEEIDVLTLVKRMRGTATKMRETIIEANRTSKRLTVDDLIIMKLNLDFLVHGLTEIEKIIVEGE